MYKNQSYDIKPELNKNIKVTSSKEIKMSETPVSKAHPIDGLSCKIYPISFNVFLLVYFARDLCRMFF